jgi:choline dehydrogenase-like flavoprotein
MNFNLNNADEQNSYDAIVVGSGISGGWAAKELTEKGLKVLVLERGRDIEHVTGYTTATKSPWEFPHRGRPTLDTISHQEKQNRTGYTTAEEHAHHFVKDTEHPYLEDKRFDWMRGYHKGGRSITWGKQSYRWSQTDFEANAKDGHGTPWPVNYDEIKDWYTYAEKFAGISGSLEGLAQLPDGAFQPPMDLTIVEKEAKKNIEKKWDSRKLIIGRAAHLTQPTEEQTKLGRASCQYRNMCMRGCPFGAYFSSQAATLMAASRTGNMTLRPHSTVTSLIYDDQKRIAKGVNVIDETTGKTMEFFAKIIFLNASTIASAAILMRTTSANLPNGLDESGELGHNIMDHHLGVGASGDFPGFEDFYTFGRRPNGFYIPRYRNFTEKANNYTRGFGYQGGGHRNGWGRGNNMDGFGAAFKESLTQPGGWDLGMMGFGEWLPYHDNKMYFHPTQTDKWGQPLIVFDCEAKENELNMRKDMRADAIEIMEAAGAKNVRSYDNGPNMGLGIHEMGAARMGTSAKNSVLNKWNQVWAAPNVFNTDGGFMTSAACVNPSLTYMAFTARAANYAVEQLKKGNL